jgi:hypothetical protein
MPRFPGALLNPRVRPISRDVGNQRQLSRSGAAAFGAVFVAFGMFPILIGLGIITPTPSEPPTPAWVLIAAGLFFVFGGVTVILDFAIGHGDGPDGNFVPGTPFYIRAGNFALGMGNVGLLAALFGWAAFGRGPRAFSTTTVVPLARGGCWEVTWDLPPNPIRYRLR